MYKTQDLVLKVTRDIDPQKLDLSKYDDFLDELCEHREFQKEAIRMVIKFLLGGEYKDTADLAKENFENNPALSEYYGRFENFRAKLEFPDKFACTIDLATATGKTWVMYGIAQIMLCEGAVDRVLILCPSTTVKYELNKKFNTYASSRDIRASLGDADIPVKIYPAVKEASKTIRYGEICIDNVHKTYTHVTSSIPVSFMGKGEKTLVLNDEAHHIMNPETELSKTDTVAMLEWKKFLMDKRYNFKYIVGFTGTPYKGNEYARDVIYRYSIMQSMEGDLAGNFVIKKIDYKQKGEATKWYMKMEEIYANHERNKKQWKKTKKHITIFVTKTINAAEKLATEIKNFLIDKENIDVDIADKKVLVVTSSPKHEANREILKTVDNPSKINPVEWIVSVTMLTEGWDVDNVFQIVPHEERAFNSKLLIAQVLGRGLRVPKEYTSEQPAVIVYNHDKWSEAIKDLVYEVWDYEHRVRSYIVEKDRDYNFTLHNLNYKKEEVNVKKHPRKGEYRIPKIPELSTQSAIIKLRTIYYQVKEEREKEVVTKIPVKMYSVDRVVNDIMNKLAEFDGEGKTQYVKTIDRKQLKEDILKALSKKDPGKTGMLTEENKNRIETSFGVLKREATGTTEIKRIAEEPFPVNTMDFAMTSAKISEFQKNKAMVYEQSSVNLSKKEDIDFIEEAKQKATFENVIQTSKYSFKCPLNLIIVSYGNEKDFVKYLVMSEYAKHIDAWIKNVDKGADKNSYRIPYSYRAGSVSSLARGGGHQKEGYFYPDFIIKIGNDILLIEIKSDEDITRTNRSKLKYAREHFKELNQKQDQCTYYFKFLSRSDFSPFFEAIKNRGHRDYVSNLEAELKTIKK